MLESPGIQRLRELPYADYLQTSLWLSRRRIAMMQADGQCETCRRRTNLDVYHRNLNRLGRETNRDLVVLCAHCSRDNQVEIYPRH